MIDTERSLASAMTIQELQAIVRHDLVSFVERSFYELKPGQSLDLAPHIEVMATKLEEVRKGKIKRLIINLPPRHLKSHCVSVAFVAWVLGHHPNKHIICASYGQDLANDLAAQCRRLMASPFYQGLFGSLLGGRQAVDDFETVYGGRRLATSIGGVLTGRGADLIIIDDPQKADDALSETSRKATHTWFDNTLLSRLNDKREGAIIIVTQRLHEDDLVGHVLVHGGWEVLSFPAIAETDECHDIESLLGRRYYRRSPGELLHPAREDMQSLTALRETVGEFVFAAQYQQNPRPLGGAIVKTDWLKYYDPGEQPARFSGIIQSWDTANKAGELNDYSVCTSWGVFKRRYWLLDVTRKRLDYPSLKREVRRLKEYYQPARILIEDKASGTQLIQDLKSEGLYEVTPYAPPPGTDKIMRLHMQTAPFENGSVLLPRDAQWLADYLSELTSFPGSRYDDQVDSTTQALDYMRTTYAKDCWITNTDWNSVLAAAERMPRLR